jgi:hypothetical protein
MIKSGKCALRSAATFALFALIGTKKDMARKVVRAGVC